MPDTAVPVEKSKKTLLPVSQTVVRRTRNGNTGANLIVCKRYAWISLDDAISKPFSFQKTHRNRESTYFYTSSGPQSGLSNPVLKRTVHAPDVVTAAAAVHVKVFCVFEVNVSVSVTPDPVVNTK